VAVSVCLSFLEHFFLLTAFLDLSSNSFTGAIPSEIGFLTSLTLLDLSKFLYVSITKRMLSLTFPISTALRQVGISVSMAWFRQS
jgi:hypothetical protein